MQIDIYPHILPERYFKKIQETGPQGMLMAKRIANVKPLHDLDSRLRIMEGLGDYAQVLTLSAPPIESIAGPDVSPELAKIGNEGMADIVGKYPDQFPGFVASLPMNNPKAALEELERAVDDLGATGIQLNTNINGKPLDLPEFEPIFARMAEMQLPIWLHPTRAPATPDYMDEPRSYYDMWWAFGWPYESSVAMGRLVFSGMFDKWPELVIITHHMGGMVPYLEGRVAEGLDDLGKRSDDPVDNAALENLTKRPVDYFRMFYGDTATYGAVAGMQCGLTFFGARHILFGTDMPFTGDVQQTVSGIDALYLSPEDKQLIMEGNARRLLKL